LTAAAVLVIFYTEMYQLGLTNKPAILSTVPNP